MSTTFRAIFTELFHKINVNDGDFCTPLTKNFVKCFHTNEGPKDETKKAIVILEAFFESFTSAYSPDAPFSFTKFIQRHLEKKSDLKKFIIAVLYNLYYGDYRLNQLVKLHPKESLDYLLLQTAATVVNRAALKKIIDNLTFDEQVNLICYTCRHYKEGSYPILQLLDKEPFSELISKLKRRYYDWDHMLILLKERKALDIKGFNEVIEGLNNYAEQQTQKLMDSLNTLIYKMVEAPMHIYHEIEKAKKETLGDSYKHQSMDKLIAEKQCEMLQKKFHPFFSAPFMFQDYLNFALNMGFRGHSPYLLYKGDKYLKDSLIDKIEFLIRIFSNPEYTQLKISEVHDLYAFASTLQNHIDILRNYPGKLLWGLKQFTVAIPTKGKELEFLPSIPSLLRGYQNVKDYFTLKVPEQHFDLRDYPIFVFDQSDEPLFSKNGRFIKALNRKHKCAIIQISNDDALKLATILKVEPLINTTKTGQMGFAGSRNSVFLLTPVLREAYNQGAKTVEAILNLGSEYLTKLFDNYTLGGLVGIHPAGDTIYMVDDDMEVPDANVLSYALFMEHCKNLYAETPGFSTGRWTKENLVIPSLDHVLNAPQLVFKFTEWDPTPNTSIYAEMISKPLLCINLPFGNEENHFTYLHMWNPLTQTSIHLGGTRYPSKEIPTQPFIGLEDLLQRFIPYTLHIAYVSFLIDPLGKAGYGVFPWNKKEGNTISSSLRDVMLKCTKPESICEMRRLFLTNLGRMIYIPSFRNMYLQKYLRDLIDSNFDASVSKYESEHKLSAKEKKSLYRIRDVYNFYKKDAAYAWEYAKRLLDSIHNNPLAPHEIIDQNVYAVKDKMETDLKIQFADFPLTQGLFLLILAIGAAEFNNSLDKLV